MCSARAADVEYRLPSVSRPLCRSRGPARVPGEYGTFDSTLALIRILPSSFAPSFLRQERLSAACGVTAPRRLQDTRDCEAWGHAAFSIDYDHGERFAQTLT
jgi:hypothetical protein